MTVPVLALCTCVAPHQSTVSFRRPAPVWPTRGRVSIELEVVGMASSRRTFWIVLAVAVVVVVILLAVVVLSGGGGGPAGGGGGRY